MTLIGFHPSPPLNVLIVVKNNTSSLVRKYTERNAQIWNSSSGLTTSTLSVGFVLNENQ